jgi:two-component sensor histidine kinase
MGEFQEGSLSNSMALREFDRPASRTGRLALRETDELLLLREMYHRHANTLMVLASLLRREFAVTTGPDFRALLDRYEARIVAFGNLNRSLMVGAGDDRVSIANYVEHLCEVLSDAILKPLGIRCEVFADAGELAGDRCERLGLVIAELVTNTAKHAFQGCNNGLVRVELVNRRDFWVCIVSDNGVGTGMTAHGVGSKILKQLVSTLGGDLAAKSAPDGTSVVVTFRT